jgi:hypothetical protein
MHRIRIALQYQPLLRFRTSPDGVRVLNLDTKVKAVLDRRTVPHLANHDRAPQAQLDKRPHLE